MLVTRYSSRYRIVDKYYKYRYELDLGHHADIYHGLQVAALVGVSEDLQWMCCVSWGLCQRHVSHESPVHGGSRCRT